jgi:hypothetical protein
MPPNNFLCKHVGSLLVTLQLPFIAVLAVPTASAFVKLRAPAPAWALAMLGMLIEWRALRQAGKEFDLVVFKGAGHGTQKWIDNLSYYRKTEDFLARCLGGRSSGFDWF